MDKYIKQEQTLNLIESKYKEKFVDSDVFAELINDIKALSSVDFDEIRKGKWIPVTRIEEQKEAEKYVGWPPKLEMFPVTFVKWVKATNPDEIDGLQCSECGEIFDFTEARNWCPECGAFMQKQSEDSEQK